MTKQEKVREGIAKLTEDRFRFPAEEAGLVWDKNFNYMLASDILSYLHSQGIVIKVAEISDDLAQTASESPKYFAQGKDMALISTERTFHIFKNFKDMGYVAVDSLIEVK